MKKPTKLDALIDRYYARLDEFKQQYALHEGAVSEAFQTLLADAGRPHHWTLIPQLTEKRDGKSIRPDGTFKDIFSQIRGHWEAKDTRDELSDEVVKKTKKGYPLDNIIFEDTREAILIQNKTQTMRADLTNRDQLAALLKQFFDYIEPQIESFEKAVIEFKERVPDIAKGLKSLIELAHRGNNKTGPDRVTPNKRFIEAYAAFMEVCRNALNPNITEAAVDDMLVQHLLTERLIREIFSNPEFVQRNVIAVEIEKVIAALTSKSFDRSAFLKQLDRFYIAIENSARTMPNWSDKQGFLNNVYERFFQGYSVKLADTMGIVYTPQPIVDFMCASVVEVPDKEFGRSLGDPGVNILDPCTGTGNFIVNLLRRVPKKDLPRVYKEQLFANEIMLLPYYIAALNIEHAYYEQTGEYEPFEGLCFVDTLDLAESHQAEMSFMTAKNTERVARQKRTPITVIIGNPPWNVGQADENDNNKNRPYAVIDSRIRETYVADSDATLNTKAYDAYVKFFRWATDRLGSRPGIIAFVSNNGFIGGIGFDGFRKHLAGEFNRVFHFNFKGNARTSGERRKDEGGNIFSDQIRASVGITILVKTASTDASNVDYHEVGNRLRATAKLAYLTKYSSMASVPWTTIGRHSNRDWKFSAADADDSALIVMGSKAARSGNAGAYSIFADYTLGVSTNRDQVVYDADRMTLIRRIQKFVEAYNSEVDRYARTATPTTVIDQFVDYSKVKWSSTLKGRLRRRQYASFEESKIKRALYRPFQKQWLYLDEVLDDRPGLFRRLFPPLVDENRLIVCSDIGYRASGFSVFAASGTVDLHVLAAVDAHQCFPFYVYDEDGSNRRENITDWSLDQFRTQYQDDSITKWDTFHYVYGLLHHPGYRTKFADNLKRELPRIPFAPALSEAEGPASGFHAFASAGEKLAKLHLDYETLEPWKLEWIETPGVPLSYRVEKMKLSKDKQTLTVNPSLTLAGIPAEVSQYRLGNRSALEWVIDQYQVSTDKRSGIVSDPNRDEDEQYIVRLVGQVVRVSVETVKAVESLPKEFIVIGSTSLEPRTEQ